jgi:2,3-bisphosphoglycerate-independent phosphoglycerate mutase
MNNELKAQIEKDAEGYARNLDNDRFAIVDFKAGAISQNNKLLELLQKNCPNDKYYHRYLESLKITDK